MTREGAEMLLTRYTFAAAADGQRVLEIACGSGQGLGLVGAGASLLVGSDIDLPLLETGKKHYGSRFPLVLQSAEALAFQDETFDLAYFFEASYYVRDVGRAFSELRRVLKPGGRVLFVNANPERPDFIRSPHSHRYHSAEQFRQELGQLGFEVSIEGAFAFRDDWFAKFVHFSRSVLEKFGLVPRTLKGRAALKRIFYGKPITLPAELDANFADVSSGVPIQASDPAHGFKVLYVTARLKPAPIP